MGFFSLLGEVVGEVVSEGIKKGKQFSHDSQDAYGRFSN